MKIKQKPLHLKMKMLIINDNVYDQQKEIMLFVILMDKHMTWKSMKEYISRKIATTNARTNILFTKITLI